MRLAKWRPITATDCHICLPPLLPGNKTFRLLAWCHDPLLSPSCHPFPLPTAITFAAFVICLQLPLILELRTAVRAIVSVGSYPTWQTTQAAVCVLVCVCATVWGTPRATNSSHFHTDSAPKGCNKLKTNWYEQNSAAHYKSDSQTRYRRSSSRSRERRRRRRRSSRSHIKQGSCRRLRIDYPFSRIAQSFCIRAAPVVMA